MMSRNEKETRRSRDEPPFIPLMNTHGSIPRDLIESRAPPPSVCIHSLCHFAVKFTFRRQKYTFTFILPNILPTILHFVFKFMIKQGFEAITASNPFANLNHVQTYLMNSSSLYFGRGHKASSTMSSSLSIS